MTFIAIDIKNDEKKILRKWACKHNLKTITKKTSFFKSIIKDNILFINYKISSLSDLKSIETFYNVAKKKKKNIYYSVRPNQSYVVGDIHLGYRTKTNFFSSDFIVQVLKRFFNIKIKYSNDLPNILTSLPIKWLEWKPDVAQVKHDLILKIKNFYPAPKNIHVILLNKCNLKCVMCPYYSSKYTKHFKSDFFDKYTPMNFDIFKKIVFFAKKKNSHLQFGQIEEPMMHKNLIEYLNYAKRNNVRMHMTTNGTLLNRTNIPNLAKSGLTSIMFSIDAYNESEYKKIRGENLKKLEENIQYFLKINKKKIQTWVSFIIQKANHFDQDKFLLKWKKMGVDKVTFYKLGDHDPISGELVNIDEWYKKEERYTCSAPWNESVVYPKGEVSLCCRSMGKTGWDGIVSTGSLVNQSFDKIWSGYMYNKLREELIENKFDKFKICESCNIWSNNKIHIEKHSDYQLEFNETAKTYTFLDN